jgi:hypothetical protein
MKRSLLGPIPDDHFENDAGDPAKHAPRPYSHSTLRELDEKIARNREKAKKLLKE